MKNINVDIITKTITISKKASDPRTAEYRELRTAVIENADFRIVFKTSDKKTYNGLTFKRMKEYIETQSNSEAILAEFESVQKVAEAKGSKYPLTKKWFLETFPNYKLSEVTSEEMKKESENKTETTQNNNDNITSINEAICA